MPAVGLTPPSDEDAIEIKRGLLACAVPMLTAAASVSIAWFLVVLVQIKYNCNYSITYCYIIEKYGMTV